jgi:gluconate 5-dehydrogenase
MTNIVEKFSLKGKIALVTRASYGIGFAIEKGFAAAGATIVFNDINQDLVNKGLASYKAENIPAHGYVCDVTNEGTVNEFVKTIETEIGPIENLIFTRIFFNLYWPINRFGLKGEGYTGVVIKNILCFAVSK